MELPVFRSNLIMPVNQKRFIEKSWKIGADVITLDLEDSIKKEDKLTARRLVKNAIKISSKGGSKVIVRINNEINMIEKDIKESICKELWAITIPKVESPEEIYKIEKLLDEIEEINSIGRKSINITVVIETAKGLINVEKILSSSKRIISVALGSEDFANNIGMYEVESNMIKYPKLKVLYAAKAYGIHANGSMGSIANFKDLNKFYNEAREAYSYGFNGSSCIHPSQVVVLNKAYSPDENQILRSINTIKSYEEGLSKGKGAVELNGNMIDAPIASRAYKIIDLDKKIRRFEKYKETCRARY